MILEALRISAIVRQAQKKGILPNGFHLLLEDNYSVLDTIRVADEEIKNKVEKFPVEKCKSLFPMVYQSREDRFYKQVAVQAYTASNPFFNLRE